MNSVLAGPLARQLAGLSVAFPAWRVRLQPPGFSAHRDQVWLHAATIADLAIKIGRAQRASSAGLYQGHGRWPGRGAGWPSQAGSGLV
jgi:hypothetical protein